MSADIVFAGLHLSLARKPITLATLDDRLNLIRLVKVDFDDMGDVLAESESVVLGVAVRSRSNSFRKTNVFSAFRKKLNTVKFRAYPADNAPRTWFKTDADEAYGAVLGRKPFSGRSLEGRIQRALSLLEEGVRVHDPMEFFEEITRFKLMQGELPLDRIYAPRELDALIAAYVAWLTKNRAQQIRIRGEIVLPS